MSVRGLAALGHNPARFPDRKVLQKVAIARQIAGPDRWRYTVPAATHWRLWANPQRIGCFTVALATLTHATPSHADAWDDCIGPALDKVAAACSAVIETNARSAADLATAHIRRGFRQRDQGHLAEALADFELATQLNPQSSEAFEALGVINRQNGDLVGASASFDHALELNPKNARAYAGRGNVHAVRHELDAGIADFDRAIAIRPEFAYAYLSRGLLFREAGNLDRAMPDFDRAIALDPNLADAFAARGEGYRFKGDLDQAILNYSRAIALNPGTFRILLAVETRSTPKATSPTLRPISTAR